MLLESMISISMIIIGLLGIITLLIRSSQWNRGANESMVATYLAAEGIEVVKNLIDTNVSKRLSSDPSSVWNKGLGDGEYELAYATTLDSLRTYGSGRTLVFDSGSLTYGYEGSPATPYKRMVKVTSLDRDRIYVKSTVRWGVLGEKKAEVEDMFTNWRKEGGEE